MEQGEEGGDSAMYRRHQIGIGYSFHFNDMMFKSWCQSGYLNFRAEWKKVNVSQKAKTMHSTI